MEEVVSEQPLRMARHSTAEIFESSEELSLTWYEPEEAIECMGFDTINKLFLVYKEAWWPEDMKGLQLIWDCEENTGPEHQSWLRHLSGFDVLTGVKGVLLGWVGGVGAVTMEKLTDAEIANSCATVLRRFTNRQDVPLPDKIFRSKWHSNKFIRGGYSHTTTKCDKEGCGPESLAKPVYISVSSPSGDKLEHPVLMFAGEALHKSYFSTTHGAFMSGVSQAQLIIDYLHQNKLSTDQ